MAAVLGLAWLVFCCLLCSLQVATSESLSNSSYVPTISHTYHEYDEMTGLLQYFAQTWPSLVRLSSLGQSAQGREIWLVEVTVNPATKEDQPGVLQLGNLHGNEKLGRELALHMIAHLCSSYDSDSSIQHLLDNTRLFFIPLANPDGATSNTATNGNNANLDANFPAIDSLDSQTDREPETRAIMQFLATHKIAQSFDIRGGALVCRYPFNYASTTPFDQANFKALCTQYATDHPQMSLSSTYPGGLVSGFSMGVQYNSLQDYITGFHKSPHVTLFLTPTASPDTGSLFSEWANNRQALINLMAGVQGSVMSKQDHTLDTDSSTKTASKNSAPQPVLANVHAPVDLSDPEEMARAQAIDNLFRRLIVGDNVFHAAALKSLRMLNRKIYGGQDTTVGDYPYMSYLAAVFPSGLVSQCGGSLIDSTWVMTSGACTYGVSYMYVYVGPRDTSNANEYEQFMSSALHPHPNYVNNVKDYDIGLVQLPSASTKQVGVPSFMYSSSEISQMEAAGTACMACGWGKHSGGGSSSILNEVELDVVSDAQCLQMYAIYKSDLMICGGGLQGKDTCVGDGGGPYVPRSNRNIIVGITSWGYECGTGHYAVFTRVSNFRSFVASYIPAFAEAASTASPSPSPTPSRSASRSATRSRSATASRSATVSRSATASRSRTASVSASRSPSATRSATRSRSASPSPSPSPVTNLLGSCNTGNPSIPLSVFKNGALSANFAATQLCDTN